MEATVRTSPPLSSRRHRSAARNRSAVIVAAVAAALGSLWVVVSEPGVGMAARTWYVEVDGDDAGTGYADDPLATIGRAVQRAQSGDTVRVGTGTFRESVQVYGEAIRIVGDGPGQTVLDGSAPVHGFSPDGDGRWSAPWSTDFQRTVYDPAVPHLLPHKPEAGWPEQFFLDGAPLTEVTSRAAVGPGEFFHDTTAGRVVLGDDPTGRTVDGSVLSWGVYLNHAHGSVLEDLSVVRYATEERHMAAVRAYSNDLRIEDLEVRDNARIGLSIIGDRVHVLRTAAVDNGYLGMHGHRSNDISIVNSQILRNNTEEFDAWHASGGMKITETHGIEFRGNTVSDNHGPGFWTDLDVRDTVVANNFFRDNFRSGVEIELSSGVIVADNVATGNGEQGVWVLESSQVDVWHNYLAGNERGVWVLDGPRSDVYDVTIGNNVVADPATAKMLIAVDDWTEQRNASMMRVTIDGNRYFTANATTALLRWANWPSSLSIAGTLDQVRSMTGQEQHGVHASGWPNPFTTAQFVGVPVPDRVQAVRTTSDPTPTTTPATAPPATTTPATTTPATTPTTPPPSTTPDTTTPTTTPSTTTPTSTSTPPATTTPATTAPATTALPSTSTPPTTAEPTALPRWDQPGSVSVNARPVRLGQRVVARAAALIAALEVGVSPAAALPLASPMSLPRAAAVPDPGPSDGVRSFADRLLDVLGWAD